MFKSKKGQTIVEIVVVSSILVIISALATTIVARTYNSYMVIKAQHETIKTLEEVINVIGYGYGQGLIDATAITVIDTVDFDDITFTDKNGYSIAYTYNSVTDKIDKTVNGGSAGANNLYISDDVLITNFTLAYLNNAGNSTTTAADVTQVKISITARVYIGGAETNDYRVLTLRTSVRPLNLYTL